MPFGQPRSFDRGTGRYSAPQALTVGDKLMGQTALEGNRAEVIKQTYLLLGLSVALPSAAGWSERALRRS